MCNGVAERAPHLFGYCFPLCYRCIFFLIVFFITIFMARKNGINIHPIWIVLCLIPMIIDGSLQTFFGFASDNFRRAMTGGLFGFGAGMIVVMMYRKVDGYI